MTANAERKRPGRPPGTSDTRERILTSARELFARNGIDKTSIRAVAAAAGVDPALVHHYYGTKQQLFAAAIPRPVDLRLQNVRRFSPGTVTSLPRHAI